MARTFTLSRGLAQILDRIARDSLESGATRADVLRESIALYHFLDRHRPADGKLGYLDATGRAVELALPFPVGVVPEAAAMGGEGAAPLEANLTEEAERATGGGSVVERGTFLQRSGANQFLVLMGFALAVLLFLFVYLWFATPAWPPLARTGSPADSIVVRRIFEAHEAVFANFIDGVEKILIAFVLPLATAVLGYMFGTSTSGTAEETPP